MSEEDQIRTIIQELNHKKSEVVHNATIFMKECSELATKTKDKDQKNAEQIANAAQSVQKSASQTIPDLLLPAHSKTPAVKINIPTTGSKFEFNKDIKLEFETTHIKPPFMYYVVGKEKTALKIIPIKASRSNTNTKVLLNSIKENDKNPLPVGTYDITVNIIEPINRTLIARDQITIEIEPSKGPGLVNNIKIISPVAAKSPYKSQPIPIQFEVSGPHHDAAKEYIYQIVVLDTSNTSKFTEGGRTTNKSVTHANPLNGLPDGQYKIQILTGDPVTKNMLIPKPVEEIFVIQTGKGQTPTGPYVIDVKPTEKVPKQSPSGAYYANMNRILKPGSRHSSESFSVSLPSGELKGTASMYRFEFGLATYTGGVLGKVNPLTDAQIAEWKFEVIGSTKAKAHPIIPLCAVNNTAYLPIKPIPATRTPLTISISYVTPKTIALPVILVIKLNVDIFNAKNKVTSGTAWYNISINQK